MMLFDSHAHYDDPRFDGNRDALLTEITKTTPVRMILNAGTNVQTSKKTLELCDRYPFLYASVGVHPGEVDSVEDFEEAFAALDSMLKHEKAVAIGEIGLDYHYEGISREKQLRFFTHQMEWAKKTGYPVILHDREAHGDCMDMIRRYPEVRGIVHSFSGSVEMMQEAVKRGWYISFSGVITFKNAAKLPDVLRAVPEDRLLIETDAPYLAPVPKRGQTNHSGYLVYTAEKAAELRGCSLAELCEITACNAMEIYRIKG